jgi:DNA-3-methyladenine glycosylase II
LSELEVETFRSCGISSPKAGYIKAVSQAVSDGHLEGIDSLSDDDAINVLIKLKGVGRWTAEMILIFALGREDVWPSDDAGLLRAAKNLYSTQTVDEFKLLGDRFKPYRSHAACYLWSSLDSSGKL